MSIAMAEEVVAEAVAEVVETASTKSRLNLGVGESLLDAVLGYLVVFIGLSLLMFVVILVGKFFTAKKTAPVAQTAASAPVPAPAPAVPEAPKELAPGSAGEVKLYDTDPRDAAMIMAITAYKLGKPLNELRFRSIKEVKQDEV